MSTTTEKDSYKSLIDPEIKEEPFYYISKIETVFLNENMNFHPNTWDNISLRWRTLIEKIPEKGVRIIVGLTKKEVEELGLNETKKEISIFGSYNRATICDIRCTGELKEVARESTQEYLQLITERLLEIEKLNLTEGERPSELPDSYVYPINGTGPGKDERILIRVDIENIEKIYFMVPREMSYSVYQK